MDTDDRYQVPSTMVCTQFEQKVPGTHRCNNAPLLQNVHNGKPFIRMAGSIIYLRTNIRNIRTFPELPGEVDRERGCIPVENLLLPILCLFDSLPFSQFLHQQLLLMCRRAWDGSVRLTVQILQHLSNACQRVDCLAEFHENLGLSMLYLFLCGSSLTSCICRW